MHNEQPGNKDKDGNEIEDIESDGDDDLEYLEQMPPPQAASNFNPKVPGIALGGIGQGQSLPQSKLPAGFALKMPVQNDHQNQQPPVKKKGLGIPSLNIGAAPRQEDEQMFTDNSNSKREIVGKLNIGKAVAIQQ